MSIFDATITEVVKNVRKYFSIDIFCSKNRHRLSRTANRQRCLFCPTTFFVLVKSDAIFRPLSEKRAVHKIVSREP